MTKGNVLRTMEDNDLCYFPEIRDLFQKFGHHGNYFFYVIRETRRFSEEEEILGYLLAEKDNCNNVVIKKIQLFDKVEEKELYRNTAFSNLYEYVRKIRNFDGERRFFQVSVI